MVGLLIISMVHGSNWMPDTLVYQDEKGRGTTVMVENVQRKTGHEQVDTIPVVAPFICSMPGQTRTQNEAQMRLPSCKRQKSNLR